ncbi:leucine dehydrogenase [Dermacentor silvarum]|uniref:leucine dehydrogenase n=1 Tax=Dermacentor silvarum TaxID=543639 RepID=UPI001898C111|nr:leucine dehydrogenase [Dermacentor silvarum]
MLRGPQLLRRLLRPPPLLPPRQRRGWCSGSTPSGNPAPASKGRGDLLSLRPSELVDFLRCRGIQRCYAVCDDGGIVRVSHPELQELADWLNSGSEQQFRSHEAILMQLGLRTGCLMTAFLWRTDRGQAYGGIRLQPYSSVEQLLRDGLRQSALLGVKAALAGVWLGGGKGIIPQPENRQHVQPEFRQALFFDYGDFLSSLNGCYVAGLDVGVNSQDMANVHVRTHWAVNVPGDMGGSANAAPLLARGVVCALEAMLDHSQLGSLRGKRVCVQGAGSIGREVALSLTDHGLAQLHITDVNQKRCDDIADLLAPRLGSRLRVSRVPHGDMSLLAEPCDIFVPCATSHVLTPDTIPSMEAKIVCGPVNEQRLSDSDCDLLDEHGVLYVPEYIFNRMAVVSSAYEMYGRMQNDPEMEKHFGCEWEHSIGSLVRHVLSESADRGCSTVAVADELAERWSREPHPLWPGRARALLAALLAHGWHRGRDFWRQRHNFPNTHGYAG